MADIYTTNFNGFESGQIITNEDALAKWDLWFGYPYGLAETFVMKTTVEDQNKFLDNCNIPWRVSAVNVVKGVTQWTIA
jgi:hypothetical protein